MDLGGETVKLPIFSCSPWSEPWGIFLFFTIVCFKWVVQPPTRIMMNFFYSAIFWWYCQLWTLDLWWISSGGECSGMTFAFFENLSAFGWMDRIIPSTMKFFNCQALQCLAGPKPYRCGEAGDVSEAVDVWEDGMNILWSYGSPTNGWKEMGTRFFKVTSFEPISNLSRGQVTSIWGIKRSLWRSW